MSNFTRKIRKNRESLKVNILYGRTPKHRCPKCGKMTLYKDKQCVHCSKDIEKQEKKFIKQLLKQKKEPSN